MYKQPFGKSKGNTYGILGSSRQNNITERLIYMTQNEYLIRQLNHHSYLKHDTVAIKTDNPAIYVGILNFHYNIDPDDVLLSIILDLDKKTVMFGDWFSIDEKSPTYKKEIVSWLQDENHYTIKVPSMELDDWKAAIDKIMTDVVDNPKIKRNLLKQLR